MIDAAKHGDCCDIDHLPVGNSAPDIFVAPTERETIWKKTTLEKVSARLSRSPDLRHLDCYDLGSTKGNSRRKYIFTYQIDQLIREIYLNPRESKNHACISLLSKKVGMPHWALEEKSS